MLSPNEFSPLSPLAIPEASVPPRVRLLRDALDHGSRGFVPTPEEDGRIDPLHRLFDPAFTEKTWYYEYSKIGDMPGNLHEKQIEMLLNPSKHRWALWGNQSGKTTLGAVDLVLKALGRHPLQLAGKIKMPPHTSWASALTWELWEKILLPELLSWIPPDRILEAPPPFKHSTRRDIVILADNGRESRITGKCAEQGAGSYQSARVADIWLDEEHPEAIWDEMQPRLLRYGGRTLATMTPLLGLTWVHGRMYEPVRTGRVENERHSYTHAGIRHNPGIDPLEIESLSKELEHNPAQLESRMSGHFTRPTGAVLPWDPQKHQTDMEFGPDDSVMIIARARFEWFGGLDLGKWRFALPFGYSDREGSFTLVDEYFSQNEDAETRAKGLTAKFRYWKVPDSIGIPADCADPNGITELNAALERIESPYRVFAIDAPLKKVVAGISRFENMLNRGAFKVRRGMGAGMTWRQGMDASKPGKTVIQSRWMYEAANWQYKKAEDGKVQKDEPNDATADGADMMDATRYIVMTYFPAEAPPEPKKQMTRAERLAKELADLDKQEEQWEENRRDGGDRYGSILRQG